MTRETARSRLHFGLLCPANPGGHWPGLDGGAGLPVRPFGGVGLMIDEPSISVEVRRANEWQATGPLAERALHFAHRTQRGMPPLMQSPLHIAVECCPPEHIGLGVGTALGLAVARAVDRECGGSASTIELAERIGRGARSAIGVHGYGGGGLIVEGGQSAAGGLAPLVARHRLPAGWMVTLHQPEETDRWFGDRECAAFGRLCDLPPPSDAEIDRLCRIIVQGILPGIASADLGLFGEAVYEYNARVGDLFAPVQGGRYSSPGIAAKVAELRSRGIGAVGQSSWGPTVFSIRGV